MKFVTFSESKMGDSHRVLVNLDNVTMVRGNIIFFIDGEKHVQVDEDYDTICAIIRKVRDDD